MPCELALPVLPLGEESPEGGFEEAGPLDLTGPCPTVLLDPICGPGTGLAPKDPGAADFAVGTLLEPLDLGFFAGGPRALLIAAWRRCDGGLALLPRGTDIWPSQL